MTIPRLGKLVTVSAKSVWQNEPRGFTPWLCKNLDALSDALDFGDMEFKDSEGRVGDFRYDILAEDANGNPVLIENQFGRSDHGHLGKLITYMAGKTENITAIWVAEEIRIEHRAAIDGLNRTSADGVNFFAVEIIALKIDDSDPAPFLRVVSRPNNWNRVVNKGGNELTEKRIANMTFWQSFADFVKDRDPSFHVRPDTKDHWHSFRIGKSGFRLGAVIDRKGKKNRIAVDLYIENDASKAIIRELEKDRAAIEQGIGSRLEWEELPGKNASRIALYKDGIDVTDEANHPEINAWMLENLQRFHGVFEPRVRSLNVEKREPA